LLSAQQDAPAQTLSVVPRLVNFAGKATDAQGKPITGIAGITFSIYQDQSEGAPLWMETQNIQADAKGNYTVELGATKPDGLPLDLFTSGEARWLGVTINGGQEQPRVLLLSVPYALKAADAQTLGGLPASAFVLAAPPTGTNDGESPAGGAVAVAPAAQVSPATSSDVTTTGGTANTIPMYTTATNIQNSILTQTGTTAVNVGGKLNLPAIAAATKTAGANSRPLDFVASVFNSTTVTAVPQTFQWQAEAVNNDKTTATGTLNLLYASGTGTPAETGLKLSSKGLFTFAAGQTFPGTGTGDGSVTSVATGLGLKGGPITKTGTLTIDTTVVPQLAAANTFTGNQTINGNLGVSGGVSASTISASVSSGATIVGTTGDPNNIAITGNASATGSGGSWGVLGTSYTSAGAGTVGLASGAQASGVYANNSGSGYGVYALSDSGVAVQGLTSSATGTGGSFLSYSTGDALFTYNQSGGYAAFLEGNVDVDGNLSKAGGSFKIDHPLDPANKYLYHSFVESPDMMNIYNGNVTTDAQGSAVVTLPEWFETLNRDFRYQLTVMGQFSQAIVASKVANHQFTIMTDKPNVEVSWQVTGIRQDAWANAHRIQVEVAKAPADRGLYLHPELFGAPREKSIALAHHPMMQKSLKQQAAKRQAAK
jgi:hypothetical protein